MKKTITNVVRYALVSLFSFLFIGSAPADAPTPVAMWNGDFNVLSKNGLVLDLNGSAVNDGVVTVSSGVKITKESGAFARASGTTIIAELSDIPTDGTKAARKTLMTTYLDNNGIISIDSIEDGKAYQDWKHSNNGGAKTSEDPLPTGKCVLAMAYKGVSNVGATSYLDGELLLDTPALVSTTTDINALWLGSYSDGSCVATGMKISKIAVFDKKLSAEEIAAYQFPAKVGPQLVWQGNSATADKTLSQAVEKGKPFTLIVNMVNTGDVTAGKYIIDSVPGANQSFAPFCIATDSFTAFDTANWCTIPNSSVSYFSRKGGGWGLGFGSRSNSEGANWKEDKLGDPINTLDSIYVAYSGTVGSDGVVSGLVRMIYAHRNDNNSYYTLSDSNVSLTIADALDTMNVNSSASTLAFKVWLDNTQRDADGIKQAIADIINPPLSTEPVKPGTLIRWGNTGSANEVKAGSATSRFSFKIPADSSLPEGSVVRIKKVRLAALHTDWNVWRGDRTSEASYINLNNVESGVANGITPDGGILADTATGAKIASNNTTSDCAVNYVFDSNVDLVVGTNYPAPTTNAKNTGLCLLHSNHNLSFGTNDDYASVRFVNSGVGNSIITTTKETTGYNPVYEIIAEVVSNPKCVTPAEITGENIKVSDINALPALADLDSMGAVVLTLNGVKTIEFDTAFKGASIKLISTDSLKLLNYPDPDEADKYDFSGIAGGYKQLAKVFAVNFYNNNADIVAADADSAFPDLSILGKGWNNKNSASGSNVSITAYDAVTGEPTSDTAFLTWASAPLYRGQSGATVPYIRSYLDDGDHNGVKGPTITVTGIPFAKYDFIYIGASDSAAFSPFTLNGTSYGTTPWGRKRNDAVAYGDNLFRVNGLSGELTLQCGPNASGGRGSIGGFIIVERIVPPVKWVGGETGDWSEATNWSSGTVPTAEDLVLIDTESTINVAGNLAALAITLDETVTLNATAATTIGNVSGSGKLVKTGSAQLNLNNVGGIALDGVTLQINEGTVMFNSDDHGSTLNNATIVMNGGAIDCYGWPMATGTLTFVNEEDVTVLQKKIQGNGLTLVKQGAGKLSLNAGTGNTGDFGGLVVEEGAIAFTGDAVMFKGEIDLSALNAADTVIEGNLTVRDSTTYKFPADLESGVAYTLCTGTLTAPTTVPQTTSYVKGGTEPTELALVYDANTVKYLAPTTYDVEGVFNASTITDQYVAKLNVIGDTVFTLDKPIDLIVVSVLNGSGYTFTITDTEGHPATIEDLQKINIDNFAGTVVYDTTCVAGEACWMDYEFNGNLSNVGQDKTGLSRDQDNRVFIYGDPATSDFRPIDGSEPQAYDALYAGSHPYRDVNYPAGDWSCALYGTLPQVDDAALVMFGSTTKGDCGLIGLMTGSVADNEVLLVRSTGLQGNATRFDTKENLLAKMKVPNAYTTPHLYVFTKHERTIKVYLDGTFWSSFTAETDFHIGDGLQICSVHGGSFNTGINRFYPGLFKTSSDEKTGLADPRSYACVIDAMRLYKGQLGEKAIDTLAAEFPYACPNGNYTRTVAGDENAWVAEGAWLKDGSEPADQPVADSKITLTASDEATIAINLDATTSYESLAFVGEGSLKVVNGSGSVNNAGMTTVAIPLTIEAGAMEISGGPTFLEGNGSIDFDFTNFDFTTITKYEFIQLTGMMDEAENKVTCSLPTGLDTFYTIVFGYDESSSAYRITIEPVAERDPVELHFNDPTETLALTDATLFETDDGLRVPRIAADTIVIDDEVVTTLNVNTALAVPLSKIVTKQDIAINFGNVNSLAEIEVAAGTLKTSASYTGKIVIDEGATYDIDGKDEWTAEFVMNGGTLANTGTATVYNHIQCYNITFDKDSIIDATSTFMSLASGWNEFDYNLNGKTLTKNGEGEYLVSKGNFVGGGTVVVNEGTFTLDAFTIPEETTLTVSVPNGATFMVKDEKNHGFANNGAFQFYGNDALVDLKKSIAFDVFSIMGEPTIKFANGAVLTATSFAYNNESFTLDLSEMTLGAEPITLINAAGIDTSDIELVLPDGAKASDYIFDYTDNVLKIKQNLVIFTVPTIEGATPSIEGGTLSGTTATVVYGTEVTVTYTADDDKLFTNGEATKVFDLGEVIEAPEIDVSGIETTAKLPTATVEQMDPIPDGLDDAATFTAGPESTLYSDWNADFLFSATESFTAESITLKGLVGEDWIELPFAADYTAGEKISVLGMIPEIGNWKVTYPMLVEMGTFSCGLAKNSLAKPMTVAIDLVLTKEGEDPLTLATYEVQIEEDKVDITVSADDELPDHVYPPYAVYGDKDHRQYAYPDGGTIKVPYGAENVSVQYACEDEYTFSTGSAIYTIALGTVTEPKDAKIPDDVTVGEAVAGIGMQLFPSLASAVAAAEDGATIAMIKSDANEATINKSVTIIVGNGVAITVDAEASEGVTINFTDSGTVNGNVAVTGGTVNFQTSGYQVPGIFNGTLTYTSGTVTKSSNYTVPAPEGYLWKDGKLVKAEAMIGDKFYLTLKEAIADAGYSAAVYLLKDVELEECISVSKPISLNIGAFSITPKGEFTTGLTTDALFAVNYGGGLDISGTGGSINSSSQPTIFSAIKLTENGETTDGEDRASLIVNEGVTITGYYYGICGNGKRGYTEIIINDGTITAAAPDTNLAIFNPQPNSTVTINGGTLIGLDSAIEMRGGSLEVTGGTLTATATDYTVKASPSGNTTVGAAVAVAQHTTKGDIYVLIGDAVLKGERAVSVANPQGNETDNVRVELCYATYLNREDETGSLAFDADGNATVTNEGAEIEIPEGYEWKDGVLTAIYPEAKVEPTTVDGFDFAFIYTAQNDAPVYNDAVASFVLTANKAIPADAVKIGGKFADMDWNIYNLPALEANTEYQVTEATWSQVKAISPFTCGAASVALTEDTEVTLTLKLGDDVIDTRTITLKAKAIEPVDPEDPQEYDDDEKAAEAAAKMNGEDGKIKPEYINAPAGIDKAAYAALFTAVAEGTTVTVQLTVDAKGEIAEELKDANEATILTPDEEGKATITAKPGLYYGIAAEGSLADMATAEGQNWVMATGTEVKVEVPTVTDEEGNKAKAAFFRPTCSVKNPIK